MQKDGLLLVTDMKCETMTDRTQLIIFVKAPRPGIVKTRLATDLGNNEACEAYRHLVDQLLARLGQLDSVQLCYSPEDAQIEVASWLQPQWTSSAQGEGCLGDRMLNAFTASADSGFGKTILIGSDCPYVTSEDIDLATASLDQNDVVLGPAHDGGYWLIGMKIPHTELFKGITWSTGEVLNQTIDRATELCLRVQLLRTLSDIDTLNDWKSYLKQSEGARP